MRNRNACFVVWVVVGLVSGFSGLVEAQVTAFKRVTTPQQRDVERVRELMEEVDEILSRLPPDVQADLRGELGIAPKTVTTAGPVAPIQVDARPAVGLAASGATGFMLLDLDGDGLDLGGRAALLVGSSQHETRWTRPGTDDAWLVIDAVSIREAGYELAGSDGEAIDRLILVSDGVRVEGPDGKETTVGDGWSLLGVFDANKDGLISSSDPVWQHLALFVDMNGDARDGDAELVSLADGAVIVIGLGHGGGRPDSFGNILVSGSFTTSDSLSRTVAAVTLHRD